MWNEKHVAEKDRERPNHPSNVVAIDDRAAAAVFPPIHTPTISNFNVTNSNKVHIGPKIKAVTQNVHNSEMVQGGCLCLDLIPTAGTRGLRRGVAVFFCWAILVTTGLIVFLVYVVLANQKTRLDIGLYEDWYLRRDNWNAKESNGIDFLDLPLSYVIIGHSALDYCNEKYSCIETVQVIQREHIRREFYDIGPNFLVSGNGYVFEGRGANVLSAMVTSWNRKSVTIMFIGNYMTDVPDQMQFDHVNVLLDTLVEDGVLRADFTLYAQCQVRAQISSPGAHLVAQMNNLNHWNPTNITGCPRHINYL